MGLLRLYRGKIKCLNGLEVNALYVQQILEYGLILITMTVMNNALRVESISAQKEVSLCINSQTYVRG